MKAIISILLILTIIGMIEVDFSGGNLQRDFKYFRNFYQRVVKSLNSTSATSNIIPENPPPNKIATNYSSLESSHDPSPFLGLSATLPSLPIAIETIIACADALLELANSALEAANLDFEEKSEIKELDSKFHEIAKFQKILPKIDEMNAELVQLVNPNTQVYYTDLRRSLAEEENDEVIPLDEHDIEKLDEVQEKTDTLIELIESHISYNRIVRYLIISHNRGRNGTSRNVANRLGVGTKDDKDEISENVVTMWNENTNWLRKTKQVISNLHWYIDFNGNIRSIFNDFCLEGNTIGWFSQLFIKNVFIFSFII